MLPSLKMPQHNLKRDFKETRTLVKLFCVLRCRKNSTAMYTVLPFPIGWIYCVNLDSMFVHTFELSSCQQENVAIFSRHSHQTRFNKHYLSEGWWLDSNLSQQPLHNLTKLRYAHSMLDLEDQLPRWLLPREERTPRLRPPRNAIEKSKLFLPNVSGARFHFFSMISHQVEEERLGRKHHAVR